jgi:aminopeptidase N/puromycin-sensitive aminopeptidase
MFDDISYGKAGAVLSMVENYLGEETFRKGVHNYLAAHIYGNATAEDFWNAQTEASHKPVDKIMESFITLPGVPILTFGAPQGKSVSVSQQRFFLNPSIKADQNASWIVPVCVKSAGSEDCEVLSSAQQSLNAPQSPFFFANADGKGYYRSAYAHDVYEAIVNNVETGLIPEERIGLLGDVWSQVRANKMGVGDYLNLVGAVKSDGSAQVIGTALNAVGIIDTRIAATTEEHDTISAWVRRNFKPAYAQLGEPSSSDSPEKKELRAILFGVLGQVGKDPEVIAQARQIALKYFADPISMDGDFGFTAAAIAAANGDSAFFDQLQKTYETSANPQLQQSALLTLVHFTNPALERRTLDYAVSDKVRSQDAIIAFVFMLAGSDTRELAWQYIQDNWDKVRALLTESSGSYLVSATGNFCSTETRDQVQSFFTTHKVPASDRALIRAKDQINDCIDLRSTQEPKLKEWAAAQK